MSSLSLKLMSYACQKEMWPQTGNHILAQFDENSIIVYQAYNKTIAEQIVKSQNFHSESVLESGFSMKRMTWIKTNFLWMMFRSGWASKKDQERILAMRITRSGFEEILSKAVNKQCKSIDSSKNDEVRLQWDPDHTPNGNKVESGRRAIQLGLRGNMVYTFSKSFIIDISDITEFVLEAHKNISNESELNIPEENKYIISNNEELVERIQLTQ